jgi:hypothetical protein
MVLLGALSWNFERADTADQLRIRGEHFELAHFVDMLSESSVVLALLRQLDS